MKSFMYASSSGLGAGRVKYYIAFVAERLKKREAAQISKNRFGYGVEAAEKPQGCADLLRQAGSAMRYRWAVS